jgi:hypothetical protein
MQTGIRHWAVVMAGMAAAVSATLACGSGASVSAEPASPQATSQGAAASRDIRHLEPRPDFVGPQPERFTWSKVEGADSYTLRIWNEADTRVLSEEGLTTTTVDFPKENDMPAGTYFWAIVGMRGNQPIAESGLAAFVVQKP